ncbi:hypothetical protein E1293_27020 [Actinomadura darangshiensis]|uniref:Uncharacterized protein n=1 Tax=Actinomadura darangshiensis TaxID=705336 RepID=A0A4R5B0T2_9ACTN|nr:hypothetical protein [Actinomadura darangshiensis]TDD76562.1 hypothetical protein E1293_27020 [Actinomadura darangshiensis]
MAAAAFAILPAGPAVADTAWTVTPGGPTGFVGSASFGYIDCPNSELGGSVQSGSGLSGFGLFSITSARFGSFADPVSCAGAAGILMRVTATGLPWGFNAMTYTNGVAYGSMTGVTMALHGSDECDATVGGPAGALGTIGASYDNASGMLTLSDGDLEVAAVDSDCDPTLINVGDRFPVQGQFQSKPVHTVTSP